MYRYIKGNPGNLATGKDFFPWNETGSVDIEDLLIWVYREQRADLHLGFGLGLQIAEAFAAGLEVAQVSKDGIYQAGEIGAGYGRVSGSGPKKLGTVHQVADLVHEMVIRQGVVWDDKSLPKFMAEFALSGTRPEVVSWCYAEPENGWKDKAQSRAVTEVAPNGDGLWCPVRWVSVDGSDGFEQIYKTWWMALTMLQDQVNPLVDFEVTGPMVLVDPTVVHEGKLLDLPSAVKKK